jgi:hypothetical protein
LVRRDGTGRFAATEITLDSIRSHTGASYDFVLFEPDGTTPVLRVPTGTQFLEVVSRFGCNGKAPQPSVAVGGAVGTASGVSGTAGATYTATEQTLINDLATAVNAMATVITAQAGVINTMRTALIADGILV